MASKVTPPELVITKIINHQQNAQRGFYFLTCNTLLHVSTLLGHLQGELFVVVTLRLHFIVELLTVYCVAYGGANPLWSRLALHISRVCLECALLRGAVRWGGFHVLPSCAPVSHSS
jgi:hypothetical protein